MGERSGGNEHCALGTYAVVVSLFQTVHAEFVGAARYQCEGIAGNFISVFLIGGLGYVGIVAGGGIGVGACLNLFESGLGLCGILAGAG